MLCKFGLASTIIRGTERSNQESANDGKIALLHEHNWALITSTSAREVARTRARRLGHPAWAGFFPDFLVSLPPLVTLPFGLSYRTKQWISVQMFFQSKIPLDARTLLQLYETYMLAYISNWDCGTGRSPILGRSRFGPALVRNSPKTSPEHSICTQRYFPWTHRINQ